MKMESPKDKICIVVLGDIGRSPRMKYHALSFAEEGFEVVMVGYRGSDVGTQLSSHRNVSFSFVKHCPDFKRYLPVIIAFPVKVLWQIITLCIALLFVRYPKHVMVQNPPAIPTLFVCFTFCKLFKAKLTIDWHNYAHSILAMTLKNEHPLVKLSHLIEFYFGKKSDHNLCVTKAMKEDLLVEHEIRVTTFYDRPPEVFKRITTAEKHSLFLALGIEYPVFLNNCQRNETVFTKVSDSGEVISKVDCPALLISSTSWTEDEDFSILLTALDEYENLKENGLNLPHLICAITGKGPLKDFYIHIINNRNWRHVEVITPWLQTEDYPKFLACGDLGVCLHTSSSGLDLPMKVVDMFGCGLPVCAIHFKCLSELVKHEENGFVFHNSVELSEQLRSWFTGFPQKKSTFHGIFKKNLEQFAMLRWHENWQLNVLPFFDDNK